MNKVTIVRPIVRPVEVIKGVRAIAAFLGIRYDEVVDLENAGAPINRDAKNYLRAEKAELWQWWINNRQVPIAAQHDAQRQLSTD